MFKKPILINENTIILIQLFRPIKNFDFNLYFRDEIDSYNLAECKNNTFKLDERKAAKDLIDSLDDYWNELFLKALADECLKRIKE